jgi:hypothetical protein
MTKSRNVTLALLALITFPLIFFALQIYMPYTDRSYVIPQTGCWSGGISFIDSRNSTCSGSPSHSVGFPFIINQQGVSLTNHVLSVFADLAPAIIVEILLIRFYKASKDAYLPH